MGLDKTTISTPGQEGAFLGVSRLVKTSQRVLVVWGEGLRTGGISRELDMRRGKNL